MFIVSMTCDKFMHFLLGFSQTHKNRLGMRQIILLKNPNMDLLSNKILHTAKMTWFIFRKLSVGFQLFETPNINQLMYVCLYRRISPTAKLIGSSLTGQLFMCFGKVYDYLGGGYNHPSKRNRPQKKITPPKKKIFIYFFLKSK